MLRTCICFFLHFVFERRPTLFYFNLPFSRLCQDLNLHWCGPKSQLHFNRSGQVVFVCRLRDIFKPWQNIPVEFPGHQKLLPGVGKRETDRLVNQVDIGESGWFRHAKLVKPITSVLLDPRLGSKMYSDSAVTCRLSSWNKIFSQISKMAAKCNVQKVAWKIQLKWESQPCFLVKNLFARLRAPWTSKCNLTSWRFGSHSKVAHGKLVKLDLIIPTWTVSQMWMWRLPAMLRDETVSCL